MNVPPKVMYVWVIFILRLEDNEEHHNTQKPASDIYEFVLGQLNLPSESCLVFEDSESGVEAAHGAGLKSVMTLNAYTQDHSYDKAELVVTHLGEPEQCCEIVSGAVSRFPGWINLEVCQQLLEGR